LFRDDDDDGVAPPKTTTAVDDGVDVAGDANGGGGMDTTWSRR
jgi:hypothetical protein